jgi:hypothetical protein
LLSSGPAHAFAGEVDAVGVMNEAIEDGIGVSRIANDFVPSVDGNLGGNHRGAASVAFFEDFQKIMAGCGVEGLQPPIIQNEQIGTAEITQETRMAAIAARQGEVLEEPGHTLVEDRPIVPTGLVAERRG